MSTTPTLIDRKSFRPSSRLVSAQQVVEQALVAAIRNDNVGTYDQIFTIAAEPLANASRSHGLDHVMLPWLRKVAYDHPAIDLLHDRNVMAAQFNLRATSVLKMASSALESEGIRSLAMKGPVLAALTSAKCRNYSDLDMLVAPKDLERTLTTLQGLGATLFPHGGWKHFHDHRHAQLPVLLPFNVALDLHWHLCSLPQMRRTFSVASANELLDRSQTLSTSMGELNVLDPIDMLIHTAGHAAWSGGDRLGWFVDIDAVTRSNEIDWDEFSKRVHEWRLDALVGDILTQTHELVGTAIPSAVLRALKGGGLGMAFRVANRFSPPSGERALWSSRRLLRLHARRGAVRTAAALTCRAAAVGANRVRGIRTETTPTFQALLPNDEDWRAPYLAFARNTTSADNKKYSHI
jgi:hypothetical protein